MSAPKFLCDAMLAHIGRRLRMAGYDTLIATGAESDHELVLLCLEENRYLLSGDAQMRERKAARELLVHLNTNAEEAWAAHLIRELGVSWLHAPFTRCLDCNQLLEEVSAEKVSLVPEYVRASGHAVKYCPGCDKVFWAGSHVRRMRDRLSELNALAGFIEK